MTKYLLLVSNNKRKEHNAVTDQKPEPLTYIFTPTQQKKITTAIARVQ
jgi:hypothetical protein